MLTNRNKPLKDGELESSWGTIIHPEPEEFAFICFVRLDDGRELRAMVSRAIYLPSEPPVVGDRVQLIVSEGLCLVYALQKMS